MVDPCQWEPLSLAVGPHEAAKPRVGATIPEQHSERSRVEARWQIDLRDSRHRASSRAPARFVVGPRCIQPR